MTRGRPVRRREVVRGFLLAAAGCVTAAAARAAEYDVDVAMVLGGARPPISLTPLRAAFPDAVVEPAEASHGGAALRGVRVRRGPRGPTLLFCPGNGYSVQTALAAFSSRPELARFDLLGFDYWTEGQAAPRIPAVLGCLRRALAEVRRPGAALHVMGHSLGAWFAGDLAGQAGAASAILVAPGTTVEAVVRNYMDVTPGRALAVAPELLVLDGLRIAAGAKAPLTVIGSESDEVMTAGFARAVHAAAPRGSRGELTVLPDVGHGEYFRDSRTWRAIGRALRAA